MPKQKVAVTLERRLLDEVDALVAVAQYPSRSCAWRGQHTERREDTAYLLLMANLA